MENAKSGSINQIILSSKSNKKRIDQVDEYVPLSEVSTSSIKRKRKPKYITLDDIRKQSTSNPDEKTSGLDVVVQSSRIKKSKKRNHKLTTSEQDSSSLLNTNVPIDEIHKPSGRTDHVAPSSSILPSSSKLPDTNEDVNSEFGAKWADDQAHIAKHRKRNTKTYSIETKKAEEINPSEDSMIKEDDKIRGMNVDSSQWVNISTAAQTFEKQRNKRKREVSGSRTTEQDENTALEAGRDVEYPHEVEKRIKKSKRDRKKSMELDSQHQSKQKETDVEPNTLSSLSEIAGSEVTNQKGDSMAKPPETSEALIIAQPHKKRDKKIQKKLAHEQTENSSRQEAIGQPIALPSNNATVDDAEIQHLIPGGNVGQSEDSTGIADRRKRQKKRSRELGERSIGTATDDNPKNRSTDTGKHMIVDQQASAMVETKDSSTRKKSEKKRRAEKDSSAQMTPTQDTTSGQASKPEASAESDKPKEKLSEKSDSVKKRKKRRGADVSASALPNDGNEVVSEPTLKDQPVSPVSSKWARDNPVLVDTTNKHLINQLSKFSENLRKTLVGLTRDEILTMAWLSPKQLQELVDVFGFKYRQGQYSAKEKAAISSTIALYQKQNNLTDEAMRELIIPTRVGVKIDKTSENSIFRQIASKLPGRSLISIWKTVTRAWEVNSKQGRWKKDEDQRLIAAVTQHGRSWVKIAPYVGRTPSDCLDRWRDSLCLRATKKGGPWSQEEEDQLVMIMKRYIKKMKAEGSLKYEGLWTQVSLEMGEKRSPNQCAVKWIMTLKDKTLNTTPRDPWKHRDVLIMVQQLEKHEMEEDTGFDWKLLIHKGWDRWPAGTLRRRWRQIKRYYLRKYHDYNDNPSPSVQEIMTGILKIWSEKTNEELDRLVIRKSELKSIQKPIEEEKPKKRESKRKQRKEKIVEELQEDEN